MKHTTKITTIILLMFLITQFIGLFVVNHYFTNSLPYGMGLEEQAQTTFTTNLISIVISFLIAISLIFFLIKTNSRVVIRIWFFLVTILALAISLNSILPQYWKYLSLISLGVATVFAILKVYRRGILTHNLTELFIYPGIAAVFVPLLNILSIIILLVLISIYDMWAVWKSKIMQKMAKFQMDKLNIFSGFFVPYLSKKEKIKISKSNKSKTGKVKVNLAILGGGDVVFPIITSGVILKFWGIFPAIFTIFGAFLGLMFLLLFSNKQKFYPAMPFISAGIFLGMGISAIIF